MATNEVAPTKANPAVPAASPCKIRFGFVEVCEVDLTDVKPEDPTERRRSTSSLPLDSYERHRGPRRMAWELQIRPDRWAAERFDKGNGAEANSRATRNSRQRQTIDQKSIKWSTSNEIHLRKKSLKKIVIPGILSSQVVAETTVDSQHATSFDNPSCLSNFRDKPLQVPVRRDSYSSHTDLPSCDNKDSTANLPDLQSRVDSATRMLLIQERLDGVPPMIRPLSSLCNMCHSQRNAARITCEQCFQIQSQNCRAVLEEALTMLELDSVYTTEGYSLPNATKQLLNEDFQPDTTAAGAINMKLTKRSSSTTELRSILKPSKYDTVAADLQPTSRRRRSFFGGSDGIFSPSSMVLCMPIRRGSGKGDEDPESGPTTALVSTDDRNRRGSATSPKGDPGNRFSGQLHTALS